MVAIQAAYRGYQIAKRVYGYAKPTLQGKSFVSKFPPQHRQTVRTILKGSEIAFSGGLVSDLIKDLNDDGTSNPNAFRKKKFQSPARKQYKTYNRFRGRTKRCKCKQYPNRKRGY